jgi:undecaprenyl-diphosphatase
VKIVISMVPAAIIGLLFDEQIEAAFSGKPIWIGAMLLLTAVLLFAADQAKVTNKKVGFKEAAIIGIAQAIALLPGVSRSGATISTSVILQIDKERAARFSFLMVMPLILAKVAKDLLDGKFALSAADATPMLAGFFAAFFVGLLACQLMLALVKKGKLVYFSIYCSVVGVAAIAYGLMATT